MLGDGDSLRASCTSPLMMAQAPEKILDAAGTERSSGSGDWLAQFIPLLFKKKFKPTLLDPSLYLIAATSHHV